MPRRSSPPPESVLSRNFVLELRLVSPSNSAVPPIEHNFNDSQSAGSPAVETVRIEQLVQGPTEARVVNSDLELTANRVGNLALSGGLNSSSCSFSAPREPLMPPSALNAHQIFGSNQNHRIPLCLQPSPTGAHAFNSLPEPSRRSGRCSVLPASLAADTVDR